MLAVVFTTFQIWTERADIISILIVAGMIRRHVAGLIDSAHSSLSRRVEAKVAENGQRPRYGRHSGTWCVRDSVVGAGPVRMAVRKGRRGRVDTSTTALVTPGPLAVRVRGQAASPAVALRLVAVRGILLLVA